MEFAVQAGKFIAVSDFVNPDNYPGCETINLNGRMVTPPFVEPHIHLDYVYSLEGRKAAAQRGTLFQGIAEWSNMKSGVSGEKIKANARRAIHRMIEGGVQYVRTHVDITEPNLTGLRAMQELQQEVAPYLYMQLVAFPQEGMLSYPNGEKLLEQALKMGAEVVGGIPHYEHSARQGHEAIQKAFELAAKYDRLIDLHCDENDDPGSRFIEDMAAAAIAYGNGSRVSASHTCAMGSYPASYALKLMGTLCKADMQFVVCPAENLHLQGRGDGYPRRRGITRVKELLDNGLNVCFGQDSIQDPWYPLGSGNLLHIMDIGLHACQLTDDTSIWRCMDLITVHGAKALHLDDYGIKVGNAASFVVVDAANAYEAACEQPRVLQSVRKGVTLFARKPDAFEVAAPYEK